MDKYYYELRSLAVNKLISSMNFNPLLIKELKILFGYSRDINQQTSDSVRMHYKTLKPQNPEEFLAIPLVKVVYNSLDSFHKKLFNTYLELAPNLGNVVNRIGSTRGYRRENILEDVPLIFSTFECFLTYQAIGFDASKHWEGREFWRGGSEGNLGIYYATLLSIPEGDAFFVKIKKAIYESESVTSISHDVIRGMLQSNRHEAHEVVMDLLKSAKLSEGLRGSVLDYIDLGNLETYKYFLKYIKEENLVRFSSVKLGFLKYTGLEYQPVSDKSHILINEYVIECLLDDKIEEYLSSENALKLYIGIYSLGCMEFSFSIKFIERKFRSMPDYQKSVCLFFLNRSAVPISSKVLTNALENMENDNLFAQINSFYSPNIAFEDNEDKKAFILAYCKQLELSRKKNLTYTIFDEKTEKSDPSRMYSIMLKLVDEIDDLYDVVYKNFEKYFMSYYYDPFIRIKHPIMREKLIELISKNDTAYAMNVIKKLKISFTNEEYHQIANFLKSKRSEVRLCVSQILLEAEDDVFLSCAKMLLQDKDEQRRNGALSALVDNYKKIENHPQFLEIQEILEPIAVGIDMEKSKEILLATSHTNVTNVTNVLEEKIAEFYSADYTVTAPEIIVNDKILKELMGTKESKVEALITRFQKVLTAHNGETIVLTTHNGSQESVVVGYEYSTQYICRRYGYAEGKDSAMHKQYLFFEEYIEILKEFSNKEIVNLYIIIAIINSVKNRTRRDDKEGNYITDTFHNAMRFGALPNMLNLVKSLEKQNAEYQWRTFSNVIDLFIHYKREVEQVNIFKEHHELLMNLLLSVLAYQKKVNEPSINLFSKLFKIQKPESNKDSDIGELPIIGRLSGIVEKAFFVDSDDIPSSMVVARGDELALPYLDYNLAYCVVANAINIHKNNIPHCLVNATYPLIEKGLIKIDYLYQLIFYPFDPERRTAQPLDQIARQISLRNYGGKINTINIVKQEVYYESVKHMLKTELERTELTTIHTKKLLSCHLFFGADTFLKAISKMGKMPFVRGYIYGGEGKKEMFSHIIANTIPDDDLTQSTFSSLVKKYKISDNKLLESGVYNLRFIEYVESYLGINGLTKAAYFFKAHMHEGFVEADEVTFARYTEISTADLYNGQMDIKWFEESYAELGEVNFQKLYDAAKYITDGGKHKRAQYFADAVRGKLDIKVVEARINDKRNQEMLLAYGLIPFQTDIVLDAITRYKRLQLFLKESYQFGAQRKQSEALKVSIAMNNLARNYGVRDTNRFVWVMEAKLIESVKEVFAPKTVEDIEIYLSLDKADTPKLVVIKDGKHLKSVPAKLNKHPYVLELKAVSKDLKEQYKRARLTLENSMVYEDEFSLEELQELQNHPVIAKLIADIIFKSDKYIGILKGDTLVNYSNEKTELEQKDILRIVHPADLLDNDWVQWQKYIMTEGIIQPFKQVFRELYTITEEEKANDGFSNRFAGYQVAPRQMLGILKSRGWMINEYDGFEKINHKSNLRVDLYAYADWFSPAEMESPTIERVEFIDNKTNKSMDMKILSPILYSETMRDVDLVVSVAYVGGVDPMLNHTTLEMRKRILEFNLEMFKIKNYTMEEKHIMIEGSLGSYSLHLGSGIIHVKGKGMLPVFPVHSQHRGHIFLPFVDEDPKTSEIISKVLMLSKDSEIRDPNILMHLRNSDD